MADIKQQYQVIGPHSMSIMRQMSPFTSLLLDVASSLSVQDTSLIRLAMFAEGRISKRKAEAITSGADILFNMYSVSLVTPLDTQFLQHVLEKIGRRDLQCKLKDYHDRSRKKGQFSNNVSVKSTGNTIPKTVYVPKTMEEHHRSEPDGKSHCWSNSTTCTTDEIDNFSQMSVDDAGTENCSQSSQMSISDDDKLVIATQG